MKRLIGFLILMLGIVACSTEESAPAKANTDVKFYNKTGEDIDSLIIGKTFIGYLKNESATAFLDIKQFQTEGILPIGELSGISKKTQLTAVPFYGIPLDWCGTGRSADYKSPNTFDVIKTNNDGSSSLYLIEHYEKK